MNKIFYHLTDKECLDPILEQGILPQIGKRSASVGEPEPKIYLSGTGDRAKWRVVLDTKVCLRVMLPEGFTEDHVRTGNTYGPYREYVCDERIPPEWVHRVKNPQITIRDTRKMAESYLHDVSFLCVRAIRMCNRETACPGRTDGESWNLLASDIRNVVGICLRIDFRYMERYEMRRILTNLGKDGEYTLCDTYGNTGQRLWEMLGEYGCLPARQERLMLKQFIEGSLKCCLRLDTGSYENPYKNKESEETEP